MRAAKIKLNLKHFITKVKTFKNVKKDTKRVITKKHKHVFLRNTQACVSKILFTILNLLGTNTTNRKIARIMA